jgi:nitrogen fixation protein NifT
MKVMLRKADGKFMIYVAKKDLETAVVSSEKPACWGGKITLENGWCWRCRIFRKTPACR